MLLIAYGGQALTTKVKIIAQYSHRLQQIFGLLLLLLAGAIYFQYDTVIQAKLVEKFPGLGTAIEKNLVHTFSDDKEMRSQETTNDTAPAASNETAKMEKVTLQDLGPAPEFSKGSIWLNLPSGKDSLSLAELKGKVVLVDFWTYSCINCIRTLPYVTKWYDTYKDKGFVVIGVHTPEFAFEKVTTNVATALSRHHIHYPVVQDNDYATWNAYNNQYWPAEYLLDQEGHIVHTHFGEGEYDKTEDSIRQLLGMNTPVAADDGADLSGIRSPEMYFGTSRLQNLIDEQKASPDPKDYSYPKAFEANMFALSGQWQFSPEKITLTKSGGGMRLAFSANKVNIVAGSNQKQTLRVFIDGKEITPVIVEESKLYPLFEGKSGQHTLELQIPEAGFEAFTFTFG
jgi:thiol-disulfide isomerase/thioredoxin